MIQPPRTRRRTALRLFPERGSRALALIALGVAVALGAGEVRAADGPTISDVCGPRGRYKNDSDNSQFGMTCRASYINGDGYVTNDNNARVNASAAVVCGFSCLSGGPSVCSGGCGGAITTGRHAYDADQMAKKNKQAAQDNGGQALTLKSSIPEIQQQQLSNDKSSASAGEFGLGVPSVCVRAGKSGSLADRIACSTASDPQTPAFVRDPRFAAEFQDITGQSLQSVINLPGPTIVRTLMPGALRNAYSKLSKKMSFSEFMGRATELVKALGSTMSEAERQAVLASIWGGASKDGEGAAMPTALASNGPAAGDGTPGAFDGGGQGIGGSNFGGAPGSWTEDDRDVSLFERVSYRYRLYSPQMQSLSITSD